MIIRNLVFVTKWSCDWREFHSNRVPWLRGWLRGYAGQKGYIVSKWSCHYIATWLQNQLTRVSK